MVDHPGGVCLRQNQCMEAMLRDEGCLVTLPPSWSETGVLGLMSLRLQKIPGGQMVN